MPDYASLPPRELDRFVQRSRFSSLLPADVDMPSLLHNILQKAAELVPSEAGAILLDDPLSKVEDRSENRLSFVAAFGPAADRLIGRSIPPGEGVAAHVYRTGSAYLSVEADADATFSPTTDRATGYRTRSIIAAPILIGTTVCGTIELLNRRDGRAFDPRDLLVLEVFASYTASSLQNALDARHAQELAKIDDLTGLYNDRYLHVRLREELARSVLSGSPCALLFLDLDRFKPINDTYGHLVGSQVLRELGFLLRRTTAERQSVLARYGGDEFAILLPDSEAHLAIDVAWAVRRAVAGATFLERSRGPDLPALWLKNLLTVSVGVAVARGAAAGGDGAARRLIRRADEAMYAAKRQGGDQVSIAGVADAA